MFVGVLLMAALGCVWADDYVDDVYFWPKSTVDTPASSTKEHTSKKVSSSKERPTDDPREAHERPTDDCRDTVLVTFLPQESETVVKCIVRRIECVE